MASNKGFQQVNLSENDVPGAKLSYSLVEKHSLVQLRRWLKCRDIKCSGNKSALVERVNQCIDAGHSSYISTGIDGGKLYDLKLRRLQSESTSSATTSSVPLPPITGWNHFPSVNLPKHFNYGHIHHHIVESVQFTGNDDQIESDDESCVEDLHTAKPLRKGQEYFQSGHVQNMKDCVKHGFYCLKAVVLASYDTNTEYNTLVQISVESGFVKDASCTCAARSMGRCAHITGLLFALKDYIEKYGTDSASCTSKPCNWNKGRKRKKDPQSVSNASYPSAKKRKVDNVIDFNPTPMLKPRGKEPALTDFLSALECGGMQPTMWQTLLFREYSDYELSQDGASVLSKKRDMLLHNIAAKDPAAANEVTDKQNTDEWFNERRVRVTASESKKIASVQSKHSVYNILKTKLWFSQIQTQSMKYGSEKEQNAFEEYKLEMETKVKNFEVSSTGFWINADCVGIGASPDGLVYDPREDNPEGLLEIKCPCVLKHQPVSEFDMVLTKSQQRNFCLEKKDGEICLKENHAYYFQVQTQLGVTGRKWCDFVVWGSQGNTVTIRIKFG